VTITDTYSSPLAAETQNTLIASGKGPYFFNPLTSAVIYAEALLSAVVKS
jgi:DNA-binding MurR/RpiR family transcriptional regulator